MVGQISYTAEQILFVLEQVLADKKRDVILYEYQKKFNKPLSASQLRYVRNKYGHDPEFGTALINRRLPDNSGNRKTAQSPSMGQSIQHVQPGKEPPRFPVIQMPQSSSHHLPLEHQKLQYPADYTSETCEKPHISLIRPSWGRRTQPRLQSQLQRETVPQYKPHDNIPEPTGTYWFDQYAPMAYETPYGYQPVLHFYRKLLYPPTTQKRRLEESGEMLPSSAARQMLPIDGLNDLPSSPDTAPEPMEEPKAKRARLESQENGFASVRMAEPAQMSMNNLSHQAMEQSNTGFCDVPPSEEPAAPVDSQNVDDALYTDDDKNEHLPCSHSIEGFDPETQPEGYLPLSPSPQMSQIWDKHAVTNSTSIRGPTSAANLLSTATQSKAMSVDTSLTISGAAWGQVFNEMKSGLQINHQDSSSFLSPQPLETYDPALDPVIQDALQEFIGDASIETDASTYGWNGGNQGQPGSEVMAAPEQTLFGDGLAFLNDLEDFDSGIDWSVDPLGDDTLPGAHLTPGVDPAPGINDQTPSSHFE
ncbi:hypothetical protein LZ31DRAFT_629604 [Colletotrichum somersetense]|nr:hypothetical protein LZ31DRAFT_629604 [Colletotrichum somersetense]